MKDSVRVLELAAEHAELIWCNSSLALESARSVLNAAASHEVICRVNCLQARVAYLEAKTQPVADGEEK